VKVKEEGGPCGWLMLADACDDGDVDFGVASVPERVEAARPWRDVAGVCESDYANKNGGGGSSAGDDEEALEVGFGHSGAQVVEEGNCL